MVVGLYDHLIQGVISEPLDFSLVIGITLEEYYISDSAWYELFLVSLGFREFKGAEDI